MVWLKILSKQASLLSGSLSKMLKPYSTQAGSTGGGSGTKDKILSIALLLSDLVVSLC